MLFESSNSICPGVVPVLVGPLQVIITILPGILLAMLGALIRMFSPTGFRNLISLLWLQKTAVTVVVLAVIGSVWGYRSYFAGSTGGSSSSRAEVGSDWPTARGGLQRTGVAGKSIGPSNSKVIWNFKTEFGFLASPAVVGNRVYISAAYLGAFGQTKGQIFCLDADTGAVVWANAPKNYRATFSSPVVAGDYLVCGEGLHETRDARIVCLDIRPEKKGEVVWTFETKNHVECTPVIYNNRVYVGAGDDGIYCLDLKPGPDGQGRQIWHLPTENYQDAETSIAVHDGKVYFGLGNDGKALCVIDADTGKELKRLPMPYPVFGPPTIAHGKIFFGMGEGDYVKPGDAGAVCCIDLATLEEEWKFPLNRTVLGAVAVKEDSEEDDKKGAKKKAKDYKLYFGCADGVLYCLSPKGELLAKFDARSPLKTSPVVTEHTVFVVAENGRLYALDRETLDTIWDHPLGGDQIYISSPVVARGHIYVGTQVDGFFCIGDAVPKTPCWPNPLGGLDRTGNDDRSVFPEAWEHHWTYPAGSGHMGKVHIPAAIARWGDDLFVPITIGTKSGLACLSRTAPAGVTPKPRWFCETFGEISQAPVVLGDSVLVTVAGLTPAEPSRLLSVNRESGLWEWDMPLAVAGALTVTTKQILVQDKKDYLTSLAGKGKKLWSTPVGSLSKDPANVHSRFLYPMTEGNLMVVATSASAAELGLEGRPALITLDSFSGAVIWKVPLETPPYTSPFVAKNVIYLGTRTGLEARSLLDGEPLKGLRYPQLAEGVLVHFRSIQKKILLEIRILPPDTELGPDNEEGVIRQGKMKKIDPKTRMVTITTEGGKDLDLMVLDNTLFLGIDGKELKDLWECRAGPPGAEFAAPPNNPLVYINDKGEMLVVDRVSGAVKGRNEGALANFPPLPSRDQALGITADGLSLAKFEHGKLAFYPWEETGKLDLPFWGASTAGLPGPSLADGPFLAASACFAVKEGRLGLGPLTAPAVFSDSRLFLPTANKGLVCIGGKQQ